MKSILLFCLSLLYLSVFSTQLCCQTISGTYSGGDIPTNDLSYDPTCNSAGGDILSIALPSGSIIQVTDIEIEYDMTSVNGPEIHTQRSRVEFLNKGIAENTFYSGVGNSSGSYNYVRNVDLANGYYSGGEVLNFKMQAWRDVTNTSPSCGIEWCYVKNNSWTITIDYNILPQELGAVGIGTQTPDPSSILELQSSQKGFLPPRMPEELMQLIPSPEEGLMVYCTDCDPLGIYVRENSQWQSIKTGGTVFKLEGDVISQNNMDFNDAFVIGKNELPGTTIISDTLMYFDHNNGSIRAGSLQNNNYWGGTNVGEHSVAFGRNTLSSGYGSVAMGNLTEATAEGAIAVGTTASATGYASAAFGEGNASGYGSLSAGTGGNATGENAIALGANPQAQGEFSVAIGQSVQAPSWGETALGNYSDIYIPNSSTAPNDFDRLFSIGNGTSTASRSNALTILQNGNMGLGRTFPESRLDVNGAVKIRSANYLELGAGLTKVTDGGKIVYEDSRVKIYGGGITTGQRRIDLYADQGLYTYGAIRMQGDNDFLMDKAVGQTTFQILASEGPGEGSELTMYNESGTRTIEIDADFGVNKKGRVITDEIQIKGGSDLAEYFDIDKINGTLEPGNVVCIHPAQEGKLVLSNSKYDKKVLGVISGANGIDPGMMMGQAGTMAYGEHAVSLIGRVYVKCNLEGGKIQPGDFLTTSSIKGEAMKVKKIKTSQGAILGKALSSIDPETGFVLVFLNLQ